MSYNYSDIKNYEFLKIIGEGNFAKVKLSVFKPTKEEFAIKIINKKKLKQKMKSTIFRENEIISKLKHPNIIKVINILEDFDNYYIIMENCQKGELFDYIVAHQTLSEKEASIFFYQLINGVEYIHSQNIVHRDLKPENLLLTENKILKIIDFGLSHPFDGSELLKTKCGSPSYASPEIITRSEYNGFETDVWCCGVILYAMLCGFLPFEGESELELFKHIVECDPEIPRELSRESKILIRKIFTPNPKKRITIQEIKKTVFYLKGKKYYLKEYNNLNNKNNEGTKTNRNNNFNKDFCNNLLTENNKNNKNNDKNQITIDKEKNYNYESITIGSNDEGNINIKSNNINMVDIDKVKRVRETQTINININKNKLFEEENKNTSFENKENLEKESNNNIDSNEHKKMKLKLNFSKIKNNYNDQMYNSFRKKLMKEELNIKQKEQLENYQGAIKTESNEYKDDGFKMQMRTINQKYEQMPYFTTFNNKNNNYLTETNQNNDTPIPTIKDNNVSNIKTPKKRIFLKINESNNIKDILNKNNENEKLILGKSSHGFNHFNINYNKDKLNTENTSFKRFYNNYNNRLISNYCDNKQESLNESNNNTKTIPDIIKKSSTINANLTYLKNQNVNSIEMQTISTFNKINYKSNKSLTVEKNYNSPWKNFHSKIIRKGKYSPGSLKNSLIKNNLIQRTPRRPQNLYNNNINIDINTINANERINNQLNENILNINPENRKMLDMSPREENRNDAYLVTPNDYRSSINNITNTKINLTRIISEAKKKNQVYYYNKIENKINTPSSLGPHHKKKDGRIFLIKNGNLNRNYGNINMSKHLFIRRGNPRSEEKNNHKDAKGNFAFY
jgi:serine/threonine protein kinase